MSIATQSAETQAMRNLWGELPIATLVTPPIAILNQQGELLAQATDGLLTAEARVDPGLSSPPRALLVIMDLVATALNNYRFKVLTVEHDLNLYPAVVISDSRPAVECADQEAFEEAVATILQSERVRRAIVGLLAQMRHN